jgi:hypothetical protein
MRLARAPAATFNPCREDSHYGSLFTLEDFGAVVAAVEAGVDFALAVEASAGRIAGTKGSLEQNVRDRCSVVA